MDLWIIMIDFQFRIQILMACFPGQNGCRNYIDGLGNSVTTSFFTYQSSVGVFDGNHVGMVHSCDAILVGFRGRVLFINNPVVCINVVRFYFVISLLRVTAVVGIKGSFPSFVVEESMGVNTERPVSHILEMDFYCIPYFAFYYWTQKAKVRWMGFLLFKGPIGVFSIEDLLVLGCYPSCTS